jgi:hypothetical protein
MRNGFTKARNTPKMTKNESKMEARLYRREAPIFLNDFKN